MRYNVATLVRSPTGTEREVAVEAVVAVPSATMEVVAPVRGSVRLIRDHAGVLADGLLRTRVRVQCARCLEPVEQDLELDLQEHFRPTVTIPGGSPVLEDPDEEDELATEIDELHTLDLTEVIVQLLMVSEPMHPLCREDCEGLCPECGVRKVEGCDCEPATDPRWAALKALLEEDA